MAHERYTAQAPYSSSSGPASLLQITLMNGRETPPPEASPISENSSSPVRTEFPLHRLGAVEGHGQVGQALVSVVAEPGPWPYMGAFFEMTVKIMWPPGLSWR